MVFETTRLPWLHIVYLSGSSWRMRYKTENHARKKEIVPVLDSEIEGLKFKDTA